MNNIKKSLQSFVCIALLITPLFQSSIYNVKANDNFEQTDSTNDIDRGLIAYLDMNDTYDEKVSAKPLTFKGGGHVEYEKGVQGNAMRFSSDANEATRLEFSDRKDLQFADNDAYTIGVWVKTEGISGNPIDPTILGTKDWNLGHNNGYALVIRDDYFNFNTKSVVEKTRYDHKFHTTFEGQWQFVVATQDEDGNASIYVNGVKGDDIENTFVGSNNVASGVLSIGATFKGNYGFKDQIALDELKIWDRDLSEEEIQYLYMNTASLEIAGPSVIDLSAD